MRDALSLLEQARAYCGETIANNEVRELLGVVPEDALAELVNAIAEGSADRALGLIHTFQKEGRNLQHFCREAIRHMRNLLIAKVCGADSELIAATADQRPALAEAAAHFSEEDLTRFFQILLQTDDDLRRKPDARVHLEMGLLRLIQRGAFGAAGRIAVGDKNGNGGSAAEPGTRAAGCERRRLAYRFQTSLHGAVCGRVAASYKFESGGAPGRAAESKYEQKAGPSNDAGESPGGSACGNKSSSGASSAARRGQSMPAAPEPGGQGRASAAAIRRNGGAAK